MLVLLRVLLTLAHLLYGFVETSRLLWLAVKRRYITLCHSNNRKETEIIVKCTQNLNKLPKHFALILGSEEPSFIDLVHIITWCVTSGISFVTFYDNNGLLKKNEHIIKKKLLRKKPELEEYLEWNIKPFSKNGIVKNGINGIKHKTRIQLLSYEDGKGEIVSLAQNLATAVKMESLQVEEITVELLEKKLNVDELPEPDLALVCGQTFCTYGFLPWHTRITEFFSLPTHHNLSVNEFLDILKEYNECEQRFGK